MCLVSFEWQIMVLPFYLLRFHICLHAFNFVMFFLVLLPHQNLVSSASTLFLPWTFFARSLLHMFCLVNQLKSRATFNSLFWYLFKSYNYNLEHSILITCFGLFPFSSNALRSSATQNPRLKFPLLNYCGKLTCFYTHLIKILSNRCLHRSIRS